MRLLSSLSSVMAGLAVLTFAVNTSPGVKPILGYNSYNDVLCSPNATWMEATIKALDSKGLIDAGYTYFQPDCGWQGFNRTENGSITYDESRFPNGMQPIADMAREHGMKFSLYTDQGVHSCDTEVPGRRIGSLGFEEIDAQYFAQLGVEYVKVDNCYITADENAPKDPRTDFPSRFGAMWQALQSVGVPEMLICQWGTPYLNDTSDPSILEGPDEWTPPISTSFRVSDDIADGWWNVERIANENLHVTTLHESAGPGNWSDMDMLEVGNDAFTVDEQKSHFALWAMSKSTLMIGTNVPDMSVETLDILTNEGLLAINQDDLGVPIKLVQRFSRDHDLYGGPLVGGDMAVFVIDASNATNTLTVDFASQLGISTADIEDLWSGETQQQASSFSAQVPAHGSVALRLSNTSPAKYQSPPQCTYYAFADGTLSNGAEIKPWLNGNKISNLNGNASASVTLSNITASVETQNVLFDYINCDVGYAFADRGPNIRSAGVYVNGGERQVVDFPLSGYAWDRDVWEGWAVRLSGFEVGDGNEIKIVGPKLGDLLEAESVFGPELVGVGVM